MKAYEAVIRLFDVEDIETVFTLQSSDIMYMLNELREHWTNEISVVEARHEQGAMTMADGYSRARNQIGVCIVGRGPAVAQTGSSLTTIQKGSSQVLILVPEPAKSSTYDQKRFEQKSFLRSTIGNVVSIESQETIVPKMKEAFRKIRTNRESVAVSIPYDILNSDLSGRLTLGKKRLGAIEHTNHQLQPDKKQIENAVELYLDSDATKPPVMLVGGGAVRADAASEIEALAEQINAVITTTVRARGYYADHPFSPGFVGEWGRSLANEYLRESDCIFAFGCSLNPRTMDSGHLVRDEAKLIQIDTNKSSFEHYTPVDIAVLGDARATATTLVDELQRRGIDQSGTFWTDQLRRRIAEAPTLDEHEFPEKSGRIDPRELIQELDQVFPDERTVVTDGGHFSRWVLDGIRTPEPSKLIWPYDFVAIGQGLSAGIGAAKAEDEQFCVTFCGDTGFMMGLQEVETAARHEIPAVIIVGNDNALGSEYHTLAKSGENASYSTSDTPDIADVSRELGADGYTVRNISDVKSLRSTLNQKPNSPIVVDCKLNREVRHRSKM